MLAIEVYGKNFFPFLLQLPCVLSVMLPGYGFFPLPDFQPHLHAFRFRGKSPSMWIPVSGESQALSEAPDNMPLLRQCHHKHIAVCQQETLTFIELQPPVTPSVKGWGSPTADTQRFSPLSLNHRKHTSEAQIGSGRSKPDHYTDTDMDLSLDSQTLGGEVELVIQEDIRTNPPVQEQYERPMTVSSVFLPLHAALSLPLSLPLSSMYRDTDSWDSQPPGSPSSPELPWLQSPDTCRPQRRSSQSSLREKSIRMYSIYPFHIFNSLLVLIMRMFYPPSHIFICRTSRSHLFQKYFAQGHIQYDWTVIWGGDIFT